MINKRKIISLILLLMVWGVGSVSAIDIRPGYWSLFKKRLKDQQISQKKHVLYPREFEDILLKNTLPSRIDRKQVIHWRKKEKTELKLQTLFKQLEKKKKKEIPIGSRYRSGRGDYGKRYGEVMKNPFDKLRASVE